ncbi:3'-5' exoribonuclease YhaM family protein [Calditrichota bacterium]
MMELSRSDHPFIDSIETGDSFDGYFVLQNMNLALTQSNKPYLTFTFTDKTGYIKGKLWDDADRAYKSLATGKIVKIRGHAVEYQGRVELRVLRVRLAEENAGDMTRFLPSLEADPAEYWDVIRETIFRMQHQGLKKLLENLLNDAEFVKSFESAPAGKRWHHGYIGGLLEHSTSLMNLVNLISDHYQELNKDLLIAGALLHDVGKIWELNYDTSIDYSVVGRLLGHITIGADFVQRRAEEVDELDPETTTHLIHLILSHQGSNENGTPITPKTREAFILHYCDEIDSKMNAINRELQKDASGAFTDYINLLDTMLYKGGGFEEDVNP